MTRYIHNEYLQACTGHRANQAKSRWAATPVIVNVTYITFFYSVTAGPVRLEHNPEYFMLSDNKHKRLWQWS